MNRRLLLVLDLLLILASAWQAWQIGAAMLARIPAPFDLEWMEGGILVSAWRVTRGEPLYGAPALDYIPFIYPPLHAWLLAALSKLWPLSWPLGRAVSAVCTALAAGAVGFAAWREGARPALAVACAAMFLGCYSEGGTFYDLVRTDALLVALLGWSLALTRGRARAELVVGGLLLALAFAAKHNAALFGVPIGLALWRRDGWRSAAVFAAASAVPALLFVLGMQIESGGRFLGWILEVPAHHGFVARRLFFNIEDGQVAGAQADLFRALPIATVLGLVTMWAWPNRAWWIGVSVTGLAAVSLMRGHVGGFVNVLIPGFWIQAVFPALAAVALTSPRFPAWVRAWGPHLVALAALAQLVEGRETLRSTLPSAVARLEGKLPGGATLDRSVPGPREAVAAEAFVEELRAMPEPVFLPHGPWYLVLAGKTPTFALITLWDIDHKGGPYRPYVKKVRDAIAEHHWPVGVTPEKDPGYGFEKAYAAARRVRASTFSTKTGWSVKLRRVWEPRPATEPAPEEDAEAPRQDED